MNDRTAKHQLDTLIKKSRVHFYKPIQVAEILYRDRVERDIDLDDLESYRTPSRQWRNEISIRFVGRTSTSSSRFQDNLFGDNATPPAVLRRLGEINRSNNGVIEAYIYTAFREKLSQMSSGLSLVLQSDKTSFRLRAFTESFTREPGLARSIDKIAETGKDENWHPFHIEWRHYQGQLDEYWQKLAELVERPIDEVKRAFHIDDRTIPRANGWCVGFHHKVFQSDEFRSFYEKSQKVLRQDESIISAWIYKKGSNPALWDTPSFWTEPYYDKTNKQTRIYHLATDEHLHDEIPTTYYATWKEHWLAEIQSLV